MFKFTFIFGTARCSNFRWNTYKQLHLCLDKKTAMIINGQNGPTLDVNTVGEYTVTKLQLWTVVVAELEQFLVVASSNNCRYWKN
jgi:hypothetical protein